MSTQDLHVWLRVFGQAELAADWDLRTWSLAVRQARRLRLLGRLAEQCQDLVAQQRVPPAVLGHFEAEQRLSQWRTQTIRWAINRLEEPLKDLDAPKVLLKGAAYIAQDLPLARGRLPSDLDILVPHSALKLTEQRLNLAGWQTGELSTQDQRYYRDWSHELPPMRHPLHTMELDLHHALLPPVARTTLPMDEVLGARWPSALPGWCVLHPYDQILHALVHGFVDSDLSYRVRDLLDLFGLLQHHAEHLSERFWSGLDQRAQQMGVSTHLDDALLLIQAVFAPNWTPLTTRLATIQQGPARRLRLQLMLHSLLPGDPDRGEPWRHRVAQQLLFLRYYAQRMPLKFMMQQALYRLSQNGSGKA